MLHDPDASSAGASRVGGLFAQALIALVVSLGGVFTVIVGRMQPSDPASDPDRVPDILRKKAPGGASRPGVPGEENIEVGDFRQGSPFSQWALARYLVGRSLTESVGNALLVTIGVLFVLAVVAQWVLHSTLLTMLLVIILIGVVLLRWILLTVVRRLTGLARFGPLEDRMKSLVGATKSDVLRELRRIGLPGRVFTLPLLAFRFLGHDRRADTLVRLKQFDTERAVPKVRLDEMHLLLRQAWAGGVPPEPR